MLLKFCCPSMVKTTSNFQAKLINGHFIRFVPVMTNGSSFLQSVH